MDAMAQEILTGINRPAKRDATRVDIPFEPEKDSRFDAMEKAGLLQGGILAMGLATRGRGKKGIKVFSGFDGASGAQTGLRKAGVKIDQYHASEIDPDAIGFTQHNYPETIQHGDIRTVDPDKIGPVDIALFGFPCQTLSKANHNGKIGLRDLTTNDIILNMKQYDDAVALGHKVSTSAMGLFEGIKKAKRFKELNPNTRLVFENVATMKPEFRKIIDDNMKLELGLNPAFEMNTKGPTNRQRVMWTDVMTADDYAALSERMKQVMPEDIIDQNAPHQLSAKGVKDNQTDLFIDKGGLIPKSGKFEPKTNAWLKGKLSTATASDGAGKLIKNGLEYNMTKKEMNRSQGNPDNFGLDYGLSDARFAKLIGNGWDQFQFKPIFDRVAMESANKIPKSEGRLGDENRMRETNEILHNAGMPYAREATVPKYGDYDAPEEHITVYPHVSKRLYRASGSMPTDGIKLSKISPNTPVAKDMQYFDDKMLDYLASKFMPGQTYPTAAEDRKTLLEMLDRAVRNSRRAGIDYYDVMASIPSRDIQVANQKSERSKYGRYRPESWFADSKARLSTGPKGSYGSADHLVQLPSRELLRMAKEGTLSVRPSHLPDNIVNIAEEVPQKYIMPIPKEAEQSKLDFLHRTGLLPDSQYEGLKEYVGSVPDWVWSNPRGILALNRSPSTFGSNDYMDQLVHDIYRGLPDNIIKLYEPYILAELQKQKTPLAWYPSALLANVPRDQIAQSIINTKARVVGSASVDKYLPDILKLPDGPSYILTNIDELDESPAVLDYAVKQIGPAKVARRLGDADNFVRNTLSKNNVSDAVVDIANYLPGQKLTYVAGLPILNKLKPQTVARMLMANGGKAHSENAWAMHNLSPQMLSQLAGLLRTGPAQMDIIRSIDRYYYDTRRIIHDIDKESITDNTISMLKSLPDVALEELSRHMVDIGRSGGLDPNIINFTLNTRVRNKFPPEASAKFDLINKCVSAYSSY